MPRLSCILNKLELLDSMDTSAKIDGTNLIHALDELKNFFSAFFRNCD